VLYSETQRFRQPWLWILVLGLTFLVWHSAYVQLVLSRPVGSNPAPDAMLIVILLLFGIGLPGLFLFARLETRVSSEGVSVRFMPFHLRERHFRFNEIVSAEPRTYSPVLEFGGWGIRVGGGGMAYNVSGNEGVQLVLKSGRRVLIGTRQPDVLMSALRAATGTA
jgi:hypothetical protein